MCSNGPSRAQLLFSLSGLALVLCICTAAPLQTLSGYVRDYGLPFSPTVSHMEMKATDRTYLTSRQPKAPALEDSAKIPDDVVKILKTYMTKSSTQDSDESHRRKVAEIAARILKLLTPAAEQGTAHHRPTEDPNFTTYPTATASGQNSPGAGGSDVVSDSAENVAVDNEHLLQPEGIKSELEEFKSKTNNPRSVIDSQSDVKLLLAALGNRQNLETTTMSATTSEVTTARSVLTSGNVAENAASTMSDADVAELTTEVPTSRYITDPLSGTERADPDPLTSSTSTPVTPSQTEPFSSSKSSGVERLVHSDPETISSTASSDAEGSGATAWPTQSDIVEVVYASTSDALYSLTSTDPSTTPSPGVVSAATTHSSPSPKSFLADDDDDVLPSEVSSTVKYTHLFKNATQFETVFSVAHQEDVKSREETDPSATETNEMNLSSDDDDNLSRKTVAGGTGYVKLHDKVIPASTLIQQNASAEGVLKPVLRPSDYKNTSGSAERNEINIWRRVLLSEDPDEPTFPPDFAEGSGVSSMSSSVYVQGAMPVVFRHGAEHPVYDGHASISNEALSPTPSLSDEGSAFFDKDSRSFWSSDHTSIGNVPIALQPLNKSLSPHQQADSENVSSSGEVDDIFSDDTTVSDTTEFIPVMHHNWHGRREVNDTVVPGLSSVALEPRTPAAPSNPSVGSASYLFASKSSISTSSTADNSDSSTTSVSVIQTGSEPSSTSSTSSPSTSHSSPALSTSTTENPLSLNSLGELQPTFRDAIIGKLGSQFLSLSQQFQESTLLHPYSDISDAITKALVPFRVDSLGSVRKRSIGNGTNSSIHHLHIFVSGIRMCLRVPHEPSFIQRGPTEVKHLDVDEHKMYVHLQLRFDRISVPINFSVRADVFPPFFSIRKSGGSAQVEIDHLLLPLRIPYQMYFQNQRDDRGRATTVGMLTPEDFVVHGISMEGVTTRISGCNDNNFMESRVLRFEEHLKNALELWISGEPLTSIANSLRHQLQSNAKQPASIALRHSVEDDEENDK